MTFLAIRCISYSFLDKCWNRQPLTPKNHATRFFIRLEYSIYPGKYPPVVLYSPQFYPQCSLHPFGSSRLECLGNLFYSSAGDSPALGVFTQFLSVTDKTSHSPDPSQSDLTGFLARSKSASRGSIPQIAKIDRKKPITPRKVY